MNPPNPARLVHFVLRLAPIVSKYEGYVYSWGRSPERNEDVGGNPRSVHLDWCACDVGFYREDLRDIAYNECYAAGLHGYKKHFWDDYTSKEIWAFHMQDKPGKAP